MKVLIFVFILIVVSFSLVLKGIYIILFLLVLLLVFNLLKIYENYDSRIELIEEMYNKFKDCCEYHRYMQNSGIYDDDLDSDEIYKNWGKRIKLIEKDLPQCLLDKMGNFPMREFEERYKLKEKNV